MAKNKISMPSAQGGLVRYFDEEYKSHFILKPQVVVAVAVVVGVVILGLHIWGLL